MNGPSFNDPSITAYSKRENREKAAFPLGIVPVSI
jgi:hypothetical protein